MRVVGILANVFGMNGLRIMDGLVRGHGAETIIAGLSGHVSRKLAELHDALGANLSDTDRFMPDSLIGQHDFIGLRITECECRIGISLAPFEPQARLLKTIPGVCRQSACDIVVDIGAFAGSGESGS